MRKIQNLAIAGMLGVMGIFSPCISVRAEDQPADWLIYVYMCGSDLESDAGMATMDLEEMLDASLGENSAFLVQTGGALQWQNDMVSSESGSRLLIMDGECYQMDDPQGQNMGDAATLQEFLDWGKENEFLADHTGLILWNHGSGSINGVCFDEQYDYDSLSLNELDAALEYADRFDFIGFDACLMGSYETAYMLKDHADYMIASEETEPGYGWDYSAIGTAMGEMAEPEELGRVICDSFYEGCEDCGEEEIATLSVIDLSNIDKLTEAFDQAAYKMNESLSDVTLLGTIASEITKVENYGGNNDAEGYTNMIDMGNLLENISGEIPEASEAMDVLNETVIYQVHGAQRQNSNGLSIYYPLSVQGSGELDVFAAENPSKNYVTFAKGMVCGAITGNVEEYVQEDEESSDGGFFSSLLDDWENGEVTHESGIWFDEELHLNDDGYYTFTIAPESMEYVQAVHIDVYQCPEGEEGFYYLGNDNNVVWEDNVIEDNFEGVWPSLPDGQELMYYILEETEEYTLYTAPIMLNGEEMNLRFMWVWTDPVEDEGRFYALGAWRGIDSDTGCSSRDYVELKSGDTIQPVYYGLTDEDEDVEEYVGEEYQIEDELWIEDQTLREGTYEYSFEVVDIFGQSVYTDFVEFYVDENGEVELL